MNFMELLKFAQSQTKDEGRQVEIMASLLGEAPAEDFTPPPAKLPTQNELPAFSVKQDGIGGDLAGLDFGVAAPLFGQKADREPSIGELLVGEING